MTPHGAAPDGPRRPAEEVVERIRAGGPAAVALSGGVDSGVVAAWAFESLGPAAVAVTLGGVAVSAREVERARDVARAVGIEHVELPADPLASEAYRRNGADRCYHCRSVEGGAIRTFAQRRGLLQWLDGIHRDDLADDRPGIRAMDEAGFFHPLLWAGWSKSEVRAEALRRGLPNWDRPSDACLASRVARGVPISAALLRQVEAAELVLVEHGFRRVRVRSDGSAARIEVDPEELGRLDDRSLRDDVLRRVAAAGFTAVTIDPYGYHGSRPLPVLR